MAIAGGGSPKGRQRHVSQWVSLPWKILAPVPVSRDKNTKRLSSGRAVAIGWNERGFHVFYCAHVLFSFGFYEIMFFYNPVALKKYPKHVMTFWIICKMYSNTFG